MKLYHYYRSSTSYRVRIALHLKGIDFEARHINLLEGAQRSEAYLALNPLGGVPCLQNGDFTLSQSLAILDYLEQIKPSPALYPADPKQRGIAQQIAAMIAEDIHPLINLKTQKYLGEHFGVDEAGKKEWYRHWTAQGLAAVEKVLAAHSASSPFALGDVPSVADICLIPHLYSMRRFHVALEDYPRSLAIEKHCIRLPEFIAAAPESQSEAPDNLEQIHGKNAAI